MVYIDENKLQKAFLEEVSELLEHLNKKLLELENAHEDKDVINEIFRLTHSIKSESALVGFKNMSTIAHKMEDIFEHIRRNTLVVDRRLMDCLFAAYDKISELVAAIQNHEDESQYDIEGVLNPLLDILQEDPPVKQEVKKVEEEPEETTGELNIKIGKLKQISVEFNDVEKHQIEEAVLEGDEKLYKITYQLTSDCDMRYPRAYLVYNNYINIGNVIKTLPDINTETDDDKFHTIDLYLVTKEDIDKLKECADVDQIQKLVIGKAETDLVKRSLNIDIDVTPAAEEANKISTDEIKEAEDIEAQWAKQIEEQMAEAQKESAMVTETVEEEKNTAEPQQKEKIKQINEKSKELQKQTIRVDIERLDNLLNLVGELIINRSRFMQIKDSSFDPETVQELKTELEDATNELERITDQMQMGMMQARMVPIGNVFSKFPRMVRDLANTLHKTVSLEIKGEGTEVDRTVIEFITEPLTHLIRNSIDHGIETPETRQNLGKPRDGKVQLLAYQEGSNIYIEVSDDGKGIDIEKIKEKIIDRGLLSRQKLTTLPQSEILGYIFEPGFSTKQEITDLSGRGVGMDVVKTKISQLRGRIDIASKLGEGTKFTIVLPLTTTIVEALLVNVQRNIFAIPITVVEETIKIEPDDIKTFDEYQVYNLRDETLAVLYLADLVGMERDKASNEVFIVVVSFDNRKVGLVVNDLMGEQDIVIKPLDDVLKNNEGIAGAAVLGGDGRIALILDTNTLVKSSMREINKLAQLEQMYEDTENMGTELRSFYDYINKARAEKNMENTEDAEMMHDSDESIEKGSKPQSSAESIEQKEPDQDNDKNNDADNLTVIEDFLHDIQNEDE
ncbi:MAG: chemotaxis protein CheA [Spirochaetes bacterium]|nr:chemotaxis protein CheA [Spirochaetota bacterium]